jgi:flagellar biogenesis protein FliO
LAPGSIEIVADISLGQKERAVLVQVGEQQILLGVAPGRVNTLHVLAEPVAVSGGGRTAHTEQTDLIPPTSSSHIPTHLQFKTILKRSLGL